MNDPSPGPSATPLPAPTTSVQTPKRRWNMPGFLGFLAGCLPLGLPTLLAPGGLNGVVERLPVILGIYGGAWVGAVILWRVSKHQSSRLAARGLMEGQGVTGFLGLCALVAWALVVWTLVGARI